MEGSIGVLKGIFVYQFKTGGNICRENLRWESVAKRKEKH